MKLKFLTNPSPRQRFALCFLCASLIILAFPTTDRWLFTWVALVPLMFALDGRRPMAAFGFAYLCGVLIFAGTVYWFVHVTLLGATLIILYLSLYYGLFGLCYAWLSKRKVTERMILLSSVWVVLEYIRAHFLSGFGWISLGHSQYKQLILIQIADLTGLAGVSFLVVMVNCFIKELIGSGNRKNFLISRSAYIIYALLLFTLSYGALRLGETRKALPLKVAVVQGNIPQEIKWHRPAWPLIMEKYSHMTKGLASSKWPDLIIWPETAFPGFMWEDPARFEKVKELSSFVNTPLLTGAVTKKGDDYHNSAILMHHTSKDTQQYDKIHLVPFGEYIPFRGKFPFLTELIAIDDFTSGKDFTVFSFFKDGQPYAKISVMICFEDSVAYLSRKFVNNGAQLLVNITNDAWFKDTKAPFMHLQSSVFRAVENRKSVIRAANTGLSCFIDRKGKILSCVEGYERDKTFVDGFEVQDVSLSGEKTFYTKFGDIFTYLCMCCILFGIIRKK